LFQPFRRNPKTKDPKTKEPAMFHRRMLFASVFTLLAVCAAPVLAQGNILINPGRVMLNGTARSAELSLVNTGETPITYRIEIFDQRMTDAGGLEVIEEPGPEDRSAKSMIRYAPRQITLEGGSRQTVRLFLRKPADLMPGEYRSHLLLRALPQEGSNDVEPQGEDDSKLSFQVSILPSLSIPVIVRHGEIERQVGLSQASLAPATEELPSTISLSLHRAGNSSLYGDLVAFWAPERGKEVEVSRLSGIAIYPPVTQLDYAMPVHAPEDTDFVGDGRFLVRFASHPVLDVGAPAGAAEVVVD
jgi:P pilus assembly chaperone PapD